MFRSLVVAVVLVAPLVLTPSAQGRCCHRGRVIARIAERQPVRRMVTAPLRMVFRGGCRTLGFAGCCH